MILLRSLHLDSARPRRLAAWPLFAGLVCLCLGTEEGEARGYEIATFRRRLVVNNPLDVPRPGAVVAVGCRALARVMPEWGGLEVSEGDVALPVQLDDLDQDGSVDEIVFLVDLRARETKKLWLTALRPEEAGPTFGRRVGAHGTWRGVGYPALESERAAYGIRCSAPKGQAGIELDVLAKRPGAEQFVLDAEAERVAVFDTPAGSLGLGGLVIGTSRPRDGDNAVVLDRVLCAGPLRAGVQVDVLQWRTKAGGAYRARLQYFMYAGQEFVELRAMVQPVSSAGEHFGIGAAVPGAPLRRHEHWQQGFVGHWAVPSCCPTGLGLGLVFSPGDVARVEGVTGSPCWLSGNQLVYLKPALTGKHKRAWRVFLTVGRLEGGRPGQGTFADRLSYLAKALREPIVVDNGRGERQTAAADD